MPDTTTPVLGLVKQTIGGNRNTWGGILNSCMDLIEAAFYGMTVKVVIGAGDVMLTDSERRARILSFSGTLGANQNIIIPNLVGRWTVRNATTGDFSLSFKTSGGDAVIVPQGGNCNVWCDGNDVVYADLSTRLRDVQMTAPDGTEAAPGYAFKDETSSGLSRISDGLLGIIIGGVKVFTFAGTALRAALTDDGLAITGGLEVSGAVSCASLTIGGTTAFPIGGSAEYDGIEEPNGWKWKNGQALSRVTFSLLFEALTKKTTGTVAAGSSTISDVGDDLRKKGLVGAYVEGTGIATGTTVTAITVNTITLSQAATGNAAGTQIRLLPHGQGDGTTTFNVPDDRERATFGRGDMGGVSDPGRITSDIAGASPLNLATTFGAQLVYQVKTNLPNIIVGLTGSQSVTPSNGSGDQIRAPKISATGIVVAQEGVTGVYPASTFEVVAPFTIQFSNGSTASLNGNVTQTGMNKLPPGRVTNKIIFTGVYT